MITFNKIVEETEKRFVARQRERMQNTQLINEGKIFEANSPELVERRISRLKADPRLVRTMMDEGLKFIPTGPSVSALGYPRALERVLGTNDLMGIGFFERGLYTARSVARIQIRTPQGMPMGFGTGFMVSPRLMLTNNHVFESLDNAVGSFAEFNFQIGSHGQMKTSRLFRFSPNDFFLTNKELDYTLVALKPDSKLVEFGWLQLIEETGKLMIGEMVNIIQHPNGEPKQLAVRENRVVDELDLFLHYQTDTAPGSSGSPVFNDQWEIVALHHSGVPLRDTQGNILTTDNRRWESWMGEQRIAWKANEGVRVSQLVANIKKQQLNGDQQTLRAEMFELEPPVMGASLSTHNENNTSQFSLNTTETPSTFPTIDHAGNAIWSIPVRVSIGLGNAASIKELPSITSTTSVTPLRTQIRDPSEEKKLQEALKELASAHTRVYYDASVDEEIAQEYYSDIITNASAQILFEDLSRLVQKSHKTQITYNPARHVYPWVDLHPDFRIRSIYSGQDFDPETLIREDFRINQERTVRLRELILTESTISSEQMEERLVQLEAMLPYNCEHVVPQSWFNKREPMRGDLHHLFACETRCNSFRGNIPYYDFPALEEAAMDFCGKRNNDKFEPVGGKGAVARASLYFLLRYPGQVGNSAHEMQKDRLAILLEWHKQNPPDSYEKHRNMAIFDKQGNRNPFIDHPKWANEIDFLLGFN